MASQIVLKTMSLAKIFSFIKNNSKLKIPKSAQTLTRSEHSISRKQISPNAVKVLYRLHNADYQVFLVGGCVRDLLLGREPKDFDVATNAKPQEVKKQFKNGRLIGKRFRIVHVLFRQEIIEVSTFRAHQTDELEQSKSDEGMLLRDNVYGDITDDAKRRDFTVNALYYNIADFSVIDFHDGLKDLRKGVLRIIGDAPTRYREDPVRMLRAVRLAAKLGFRIEKKTEAPIDELRYLLKNIAPARLFTEILKLFLGGQALDTFKQLRHYKLFEFLFPATEHALNSNEFARINSFISLLLQDTDDRIAQGKTVSPGYLAAALLWYPFLTEFEKLNNALGDSVAAFNIAYTNVHSKQQQAAAIPKHFMLTARTIWEMQFRMETLRASKCYGIVRHQRFRAAYDFLQLRMRSGEALDKTFDWWCTFYNAGEEKRLELLAALKTKRKKAPRKRKPKKNDAP